MWTSLLVLPMLLRNLEGRLLMTPFSSWLTWKTGWIGLRDKGVLPQPKGKKTRTLITLGLKTEREKSRIKKLEQQSLESKPWQLSGETSATQRPENSLLEEHLQFDFISRNAPLITEESTKNLEEIIKSRIKDESWDD